jgi:hypothetical protein
MVEYSVIYTWSGTFWTNDGVYAYIEELVRDIELSGDLRSWVMKTLIVTRRPGRSF